MSYTFDQDGVAFYYFILTALAIYLIPATLSRTFGRKSNICDDVAPTDHLFLCVESSSKSQSPVVPGYAQKKLKSDDEETKGFLSFKYAIIPCVMV